MPAKFVFDLLERKVIIRANNNIIILISLRPRLASRIIRIVKSIRDTYVLLELTIIVLVTYNSILEDNRNYEFHLF